MCCGEALGERGSQDTPAVPGLSTLIRPDPWRHVKLAAEPAVASGWDELQPVHPAG